MRKNTKCMITKESEELEEGKLANSLMLSLSLMLSGLANISCSMVTPIEAECEYGCVGCYNKITDDQTVDILKKYFDKAENKFILNHLIDSHSGGTTMLGATQMAIYNIDSGDEWFTAEIKLNDNFIKKYSRLTLHLPDEFTRGLVIIHELCHVLHYRDSHNSNWLNDFKPKIEKYCWDCIDDDLVEYHGENKKYETPQELINFIIDEATSQYIKESIRKSIKESNFKKSDAKVALQNVLKNGEEFDIPFKYSDEWVFTDAIEDELERQGFSFENSFRDKNYGSVEEYSDGLETVYVIMDRSLSNRGICVGLVTEL